MEMNRIHIVIPPYHKRNGSSTFFPLGIGHLMSYLQINGYEVQVLDYTEQLDDIRSPITEQGIDELIIAMCAEGQEPLFWGIGPVTTASAPFIKQITESIKRVSDKPIICGGPLASIEDQIWFFFDYVKVDGVVRGDGEYALLSLADTLANGRNIDDCKEVSIPSHITEFQTIENIDDLPFPSRPPAEKCRNMHPSIRRGVLPSPVTTIVTMRGCPYRCAFCVSGNLRKTKKYSLSRIIQELKEIERLGYKSVIFYDDCMFFGKKAKRDIFTFCKAISNNEINLCWTMELRPDVFQTLDVNDFSLLSNSGCKEISIGFESVSKESQQLYKKQYNLEQITHACNAAIAHSILIAGTFIIGGPAETLESIDATIAFAKKCGIIFAHFTPLEIYPGTPLYSTMFGNDNKGWFVAQQKDEYGWNEVIYCNSNISAQRLIDKSSEAYSLFYDDTWFKKIKTLFQEGHYQDSSVLQEMIMNRYNFKNGGKNDNI